MGLYVQERYMKRKKTVESLQAREGQRILFFLIEALMAGLIRSRQPSSGDRRSTDLLKALQP
jgi:hypothetical protein